MTIAILCVYILGVFGAVWFFHVRNNMSLEEATVLAFLWPGIIACLPLVLFGWLWERFWRFAKGDE